MTDIEIPYTKIDQHAKDLADLLVPNQFPKFFNIHHILNFILPGYIKTVRARMKENLDKE